MNLRWLAAALLLLLNMVPLMAQQPTAAFTWKPVSDGYSWGYVSFDASSSYDPDGSIVSYEWQFENPDGTVTVTFSDHPWMLHYYGCDTFYYPWTVSLIVTDNNGAKGGTMQSIYAWCY